MAGDPPLKQVVTRTLEAGLRGAPGGAAPGTWACSAPTTSDDILFVADNAAGFGYFRNFGKTRRQGMEAGARRRVGPASAWAPTTPGSTRPSAATRLRQRRRQQQQRPGGSRASRRRRRHRDAARRAHPAGPAPACSSCSPRCRWAPAFSIGADLHRGVSGVYARGNENNAHQPDGTYYLGPGRSAGYAVVNLGARLAADAGR